MYLLYLSSRRALSIGSTVNESFRLKTMQPPQPRILEIWAVVLTSTGREKANSSIPRLLCQYIIFLLHLEYMTKICTLICGRNLTPLSWVPFTTNCRLPQLHLPLTGDRAGDDNTTVGGGKKIQRFKAFVQHFRWNYIHPSQVFATPSMVWYPVSMTMEQKQQSKRVAEDANSSNIKRRRVPEACHVCRKR
jgi:hypothetical protein